jgi:hypothetical protein
MAGQCLASVGFLKNIAPVGALKFKRISSEFRKPTMPDHKIVAAG